MKNTKDRIIYNALMLFSDKGYVWLSMRDIAKSVNIKASSIYNHFKNKEDIFNHIIDEASTKYEAKIKTFQIPDGEISYIATQYIELSEEMLLMISKDIFLYFLKDDFASKFRKMLTI